jgi:putative zinc finger/helix-turn-helix YgiT family protein
MKQSEKKCATCREGTLTPTTLDYTAEMEHDGRAYTVTVNNLDLFVCDKCQARVLPDASYSRLEDELRRQAGLLMPAEIAERREQLGLSQQDFACLLGVAPATVSRWEAGAQIQPRVLNDFMQAFFDLPELQKYLRRRRGMASAPPRIVGERPA